MKHGHTRYVFVTGGVVSSLGKGLFSASLALLLKDRGFNVRVRKFDPYLNVDSGTMNPTEHGEVFVTTDGRETDMDLGHYERFTEQLSCASDCVTSGLIHRDIINKERQGEYLSSTIQVIPHVTDAIKKYIFSHDPHLDFIITEIGGTVGDIESLPFLEALRQIKTDLPAETLFIHMTLLPYLSTSREFKTKPTQRSFRELCSSGIVPHIIICRSDEQAPRSVLDKIASMCGIQHVFNLENMENIYEVPVKLRKEGFDSRLLDIFCMSDKGVIGQRMGQWQRMLSVAQTDGLPPVNIVIVAKYMDNADAYKSLVEALVHGCNANGLRLNIKWINGENLTPENVSQSLQGAGAVLVPGGFGKRGIEGKITAADYARERGIPFLGICLGMQCACIAFARSCLNMIGANSQEMDPDTPHAIVVTFQKQEDMGGTMRLGNVTVDIQDGTKASMIYGQRQIVRRHRHRYCFNMAGYRKIFSDAGMMFSGTGDWQDKTTKQTMVFGEIMEYQHHPWYIGVQYHPELDTRFLQPEALYVSFTKAAFDYQALDAAEPVISSVTHDA